MPPRSWSGPLVALVSFASIATVIPHARSLGAPAPSASAPAGHGREPTPGPEAWAGGEPSLDALSARVVEALERRDRGSLQALTISRSEYRELVFPRLGLDAHAGADFYFDNLSAGSLRDLDRALARLGGFRIELLAVEVDAAQAERHEGLTIHRGITLRLRVDGQLVEAALLGGVVEHAGRFKLMRYRTPERS